MKRIILLSMLLLASLGIAGRSSAQGSQPTPFDASGDVTEPIFITTPITSFGDSGSIDIAPEGGSVSLYFQVDSPLASGNILDCFTNVGDQKVEHLFSDVSLPEYTGNVEGNLELTLVENVSGLTRTIVIASRTNEVTLVQLPRSSAVYRFGGTPGVIYPTQQAVFTLSGSDRFATYELFRDGEYVEMIQGTGRPLRYEISALAGTYSVLSQPLDVSMNGSVTLTLHPSFATAYPLTLASLTFPADGGKVSVGFTRTLTATEQARLAEAVAALNSGSIATWDSENMIVTYAGGALTVGCRPNLTSQARSYDSYLRTTSGATLSASQPAGGKLYAYDIRYDSVQHCVWLSGSQYGVTYVLHCNGEQAGVPTMGTGAAISLRVPDEGTFTVQGRVGYERIDMNGSVVIAESRATPTEGTNYILTATYTAECAQEKVEDITYYDGLGYPEQVIRIGATGNGGNIVEPIVYDSMRRADARVYLPYAVAGTSAERIDDPLSAQAAYYTSLYGAGEAAYAYREKVYERSALDRPLAALNAGAAFRGEQEHRSEFSYGTNSSAQVLRLRVTATGSLVGNGYYPASVLRKQTVIDEDGASTERFTDAQDRLVLERRLLTPAQHVDTYHVYDDYGRLAWVVSPEGSGLLTTSSSWTIDCDNASKYCYRYTYDGRGRQIERRLPGREAEYMVYDPAGRLRLYQDGNLRAVGRWIYKLYDNLGRLVDESVVTGSKTRSQLQSIYDTTPDNYTYSDRTASYLAPPLATGMKLYAPLRRYRYGDLHHASGKVNAIPAALAFLPVPGIAEQSDLSAERDAGLLRYEYAMLADSVLYKPALNPALPGGPIELLGSLPSGDIGAIVRPDASPGPCVERAYYYDSKCRVIQKVERDHTGGILRTSLRYDFRGNVLCSRQHYTKGSVTDYLTQTFTYDPRGRLLAETSRVNAGPTASVHYTYDDLGRLTGKTYGSGTHAVSETLAYNIQGWRTGQQVKKGSTTLFESTLHYYDPVQSATVPSFTGNITEWVWQHGAASETNRYAFTYDRLARLTDSRRYVAGVETTAHSEKGLYYDRNGNLTALKRYGSTALDDDFTYTYNGNRINTLTDGTTSYSYAYDANGNTKRDGLHNLDIDYNFLNLPWKVQQSKTMKARYSYYADGTKYSVSDASGSSRIYAGNLVYVKRNGVEGLESAAFGGGRFRTSLVIGGITYIPDYFITDHLGSTRAIIESGETVAQYNYYPYGGEWSTATQLVSDDNRYKFSGKEDQATFGAPIYDFHARSYTSRVPMFLQQDPKATDYYSISPYAYCAGDPVNRIDPEGMDWYEFDYQGDYVQKHASEGEHRIVLHTVSKDENGLEYSTYKFYEFADPENDPKNIENGKIDKLIHVSNDEIQSIIEEQGGFSSGKVKFAWESQGGRNFDYSTILSSKYPGSGSINNEHGALFLPEGESMAHNYMNFGNYLWGATGYTVGFNIGALQIGAHLNSLFNSRKNGYAGQWDSVDDQRSIKKGFFHAVRNNYRNLK